jgi:hydrogenase maturation protein HypF
MCCPNKEFKPYDFDLSEVNDRLIMKPQPLIRQLIGDVLRGRSREEISGRFHWGVIEALAEATRKTAASTGIDVVVMSGGCFQNQILTQGLFRKLEATGLRVYTQESAPVNDGGLSLGQAVIAGHRCRQ